MKSDAKSPDEYIDQLPPERRQAMAALRRAIVDNLPEGFVETMGYGMIGYVVPHSRYPAGYRADPSQPLPFINLASQKKHLALYHLGLYAEAGLLEWFLAEYARLCGRRPDMGKGCIRFRPGEDLPLELIGALVRRLPLERYLAGYEARGLEGQSGKPRSTL
jgi:hypothetical protein